MKTLQQDKTSEREFFDKFDHDNGYDRFHEKSYAKIFNLFERLVKPQAGETILDMGCGSGAFTIRLSERFPMLKTSGLDLSPGCISHAGKMYPALEFTVGDAEHTGLPSNSIDIICFFGVLHHFSDFTKVLQEAHRVLKPGGRFFSFDPHYYNPFFWLYRVPASPFYSSVGVTPNECPIKPSALRGGMKEIGFQGSPVVMSGIRFCSAESKAARRLLSVYNGFDLMLGMTPLARLVGAWVVCVGEKKN